MVAAVDAYGIGLAAWRLGAGRARKEDPVSSGAGVLLHVRPGDPVRAGDPLLELRTDEAGRIAGRRAEVARAGAVARSVGRRARLGANAVSLDRDRLTRPMTEGRARSRARSARPASTSWSGSACRCRRPASRWSGSRATSVELRPTERDRGARRDPARGGGPLLRHAARGGDELAARLAPGRPGHPAGVAVRDGREGRPPVVRAAPRRGLRAGLAARAEPAPRPDRAARRAADAADAGPAGG